MVAAGAQPVNDQGQRFYCLCAIASSIVQEDNVPMIELIHHLLNDLRRPGSRLPIVRIDLVADGDVVHILHQLQGPDFVGSIWLLINGIGRTEI